MNLRPLLGISTIVLGLAWSGTAFAQETDDDHEAHEKEATSSSAESVPAKSTADDDESSDDAARIDGGDMMMCGRMMAMMGERMNAGGEPSRHDAMNGPGMHDMMKAHSSIMAGDNMKMHGKAGMARQGFAHLLNADEIGTRLTQMIAHNKRLKFGKLEPGGDFSFAAEITTVDGSLVHKLLIDRRDGTAWEID